MPTIFEVKERETTETPLFLFECKLRNGTVERWSSHSVEIDSNRYEARILSHNALDLKVSFDESLEAGNKLVVRLGNCDGYVSQLERTVGWKGGQVSVSFVFFNLKDDLAASETRLLFKGIANAPEEITEESGRLSFTSRLSHHRIQLPETRIQKLCPWAFPRNSAEREAALNGGLREKYSPLFRCGYSADQPGGTGNLQANGQPFTSCGKTREDCAIRGMLDRDSAGQPTTRFGGIGYVPASVLVRSHGEKGSHAATVASNDAKYDDAVPLLYGTVWFDPPVIFARNDGNLTRMEVLVSMGEIDSVVKVLVNDVEIPQGVAGMDMTASGWFNLVTAGARNGGLNADFSDASNQSISDPHGSMAALSVVVPNRVSEGKALPKVQVLARGLRLPKYALDGTPLGEEYSNNPAWVLLDLLRRSGWEQSDLDIPSFSRAAEVCAAPIAVKDLYGNVTTVPRFQCNLVLRKRRSAADIIRGVRSGSMLILTFGDNGLLQVAVEGTLEEQASAKPDGSNSIEQLNGGWPSYEFGDGSNLFSGILRTNQGASSLRLWSRTNAECPNRFSVEFQDEFNEYQQDSLSLVDPEDTSLTGQEVSANLTALGLPNFDQATRVMLLAFHKALRGNQFAEFETSVRGFGLKPGDLITITYAREGLDRQAFRIVKVQPSLNFRTCRLTVQLHDDAWYLTNGGGGQGGRRQPANGTGVPRPLIGTSIIDGEPNLDVTESIRLNADGSSTAVLAVEFQVPESTRTSKAPTPIVNLSANVSSTGGTLQGGHTYYYALSAVDSTGVESPLSFIVPARVLNVGSTNTVTLTGLSFGSSAVGFRVYRGRSISRLFRIASDLPPSTQFIDDGSSVEAPIGPPDENFDHANFYWRMERVPESQVTASTTNSVTVGSLQLLANEHRGATLRITKGKGAGQERIVVSNTNTSITVSSPFVTVPDSTSHICVAEASWSFAVLSSSSPVEFEVPNRTGATVHISGRAANIFDLEAPYELSPLRRWVIGGGGTGGADTDVPPEPQFAVGTDGDGTVEIAGIGFQSLDNTRSVTSGTLVLWVWNEVSGEPQLGLASIVGATDSFLVLSRIGGAIEGQLLQIGSEVMRVLAVLDGGTRYEVSRGFSNTIPQEHASGALVYELERETQVLAFPKNFFGSPAGGSYSHRFPMPGVRVVAADLFVTNAIGNGLTRNISFASTSDLGLRTLTGGQISLEVDGFLATENTVTPSFFVDGNYPVRDVFARLGEPADGGDVVLRLRRNGDDYCALTIPNGSVSSETIDGRTLAPILAMDRLDLDIVSVATAWNATPGKDLTVSIRL